VGIGWLGLESWCKVVGRALWGLIRKALGGLRGRCWMGRVGCVWVMVHFELRGGVYNLSFFVRVQVTAWVGSAG